MSNIILTGDRPTGKLHIGHYVGSLRRRVELQNSNEFDEIYIMIADVQALTDHAEEPEKIRDHILEVALDYLACGLDPNKVNIFIQSQIPELYELFTYYMNLVSLSRLERNPTVKTEIKQKGYEHSIPVGFLTYPISQAADITAFDANNVPVGEDQLPMIEQCQEIVRKFNSVYGEVLVYPKASIPEQESCLRLPGTDGKSKMSKSLGNCIYLSDDSETLRKKVMSMYTDPNHLKISDPGDTENNPVFIYLDAFAADEQIERVSEGEYKNLNELKSHYERGGLGDVKVKKILFAILDEILSPIRERREELSANLDYVYSVLEKGTEKARTKATATLKKVKDAMKINYFEGDNFIKEQKERLSK